MDEPSKWLAWARVTRAMADLRRLRDRAPARLRAYARLRYAELFASTYTALENDARAAVNAATQRKAL